MHRFVLCSLLTLATASVGAAQPSKSGTGGGRKVKVADIPSAEYVDVVTEQGQRAAGYYVTGPFAHLKGPDGLARSIKRMGLNAAVIDLKDGAGRVSYDTKIEILQEQKHPFIPDLPGFISALKKQGIYTIARVVCFADPKLPERHPERAILHVRRKTPWTSWGTAGTWLDPYNTLNHDMIVELAKEAEAAGFDEVQLDYIRWPVDDGIKYAMFPAEKPDSPVRWKVLLGLLKRIDAAIKIPLGADVFGLTAFDFGDDRVLGQRLHEWAGHIEVYSPMLYINAMRGWAMNKENRAYSLLYTGVGQMRNRLGDRVIIRPFLQSFAKGKGHEEFNPKFIADQIRGSRDAGADGFLFWHPGSKYTMLLRGMLGPGRGLLPFPIEKHITKRHSYWNNLKSKDSAKAKH